MSAIAKKIIILGKSAWAFICWLWKTIWRFLTHTETPLGITLLLFIGTGFLTYYFTPKLNQIFEQQKMVSTFVTENLNDFNISCRELISSISILVHDLATGNQPDHNLKSKIRGKITELQWRAVQLDIIFENEKAAEIIREYKASLTALGNAIEKAQNKSDSDKIAMVAIVFTDNSVHVIDALAGKAGLKIHTSVDTTSLKQPESN